MHRKSPPKHTKILLAVVGRDEPLKLPKALFHDVVKLIPLINYRPVSVDLGSRAALFGWSSFECLVQGIRVYPV